LSSDVSELPKIHLFFTIFRCYVGLSDGVIPDGASIGLYPNSYAIATSGRYLHLCWLTGEGHHLELPEGVIKLKWKSNGINVHGCGLVLDPKDNLAIFFTLNGKLMGEFMIVDFRISKQKNRAYFR
jgi:hypothetical protein